MLPQLQRPPCELWGSHNDGRRCGARSAACAHALGRDGAARGHGAAVYGNENPASRLSLARRDHNAFAEAGTIGALADWFAVTASVRHPFGLPIPHTAMAPSASNEFGRALAQLFRDHFLVRDAVEMRLEGPTWPSASAAGSFDRITLSASAEGRTLSWLIDETAAQPRAMLYSSVRTSLDNLPVRAALSVVVEGPVHGRARRNVRRPSRCGRPAAAR